MNAFQKCRNASDAVPLYLPQQLYLKPAAQVSITIQLPQKLMGKSVSNWELMEKLRSMISPEEYAFLKVTKSTIEFIRFEAELDDKNKLQQILTKLDNKLIKLKEFQDLFKIRASESRQDYPNKHVWDSFFREAKDMNEMKPGERPDTIHISNLPIRWFVPYHLSGEEDLKPSEKIFQRVFEKFGRIRNVDVPICDPYRKQMKSHMSGLQTFSFDEKDFFEGYVQFKDYIGFTKTMDAFRGMKLLHKNEEYDEIFTVKIKVDFDRTKHMTDAAIKRREIVRERLIRKEKEKEEKERHAKEEILRKEQVERQKEIDLKREKEKRRREREEKRKAKILAQLKVKDADDINDKIAKEEKKLLKAQRKLEAIRLVEELFKRIKIKHQDDLTPSSIKNRDKQDELTRYKASTESFLHNQREKLHRAIEGRVVLKSVLAGPSRIRQNSSSSDTSLSPEEVPNEKDMKFLPNLYSVEQSWYPYSPQNGAYPYTGPLYPQFRGHPYHYPFNSRGRGAARGLIPSTSRGPRRGRGTYYRARGQRSLQYYPPELQEEYYKYFQKFLQDSHDDRDYRSYSRSRSRSKSRSYRRSRSRRRSYSRSRHSYSRSRSRDRRTRSRSRRKSPRSRSRSRSRGSRTKSRSNSRDKRSRSSNKSVDSSKFVSPNQMRTQKSRPWSLPKTSDKNTRRSWSKTLSP